MDIFKIAGNTGADFDSILGDKAADIFGLVDHLPDDRFGNRHRRRRRSGRSRGLACIIAGGKERKAKPCREKAEMCCFDHPSFVPSFGPEFKANDQAGRYDHTE
jgi:hypothetical protein